MLQQILWFSIVILDCSLQVSVKTFPLLFNRWREGLISTPPSDMLPTAEGGKANAWLRQKSAGIYVRPRLFSPYVEEAKVGYTSSPHTQQGG